MLKDVKKLIHLCARIIAGRTDIQSELTNQVEWSVSRCQTPTSTTMKNAQPVFPMEKTRNVYTTCVENTLTETIICYQYHTLPILTVGSVNLAKLKKP